MDTKDFIVKVQKFREKVKKEYDVKNIPLDEERCQKRLEYVLSERYNQDYWISKGIEELAYKLGNIYAYNNWDAEIVPIINNLKDLCKSKLDYRKEWWDNL